MALITIPTSIDGINIPGFGLSGGSGPLASLYGNAGQTFYKYPRDLGSSTKSHAVVFTIKKINETTLAKAQEGFVNMSKDVFGSIKPLVEAGAAKAVEVYEDPLGEATKAFEESKSIVSGGGSGVVQKVVGGLTSGLESVGTGIGKISNFISNKETEIIASIALYMPETMSFTNSAQYDGSTTLASAAGSLPLLGRVTSKLTDALGGNDALKLALNAAGYVFNPQKQLLFQGIEFRQFNMSFTFTPYSAKEAQDVKEIIKLFRQWSSPQKAAASGGMFWNPPALFEVKFLFNSTQNLNIPKLKDCVIESVEVNYAPNGWAAHADGAPVQTTITLQLQEIALVDRSDIDNGY
jgi:hypothetical protein